jgi:hypothetical protein
MEGKWLSGVRVEVEEVFGLWGRFCLLALVSFIPHPRGS